MLTFLLCYICACHNMSLTVQQQCSSHQPGKNRCWYWCSFHYRYITNEELEVKKCWRRRRFKGGRGSNMLDVESVMHWSVLTIQGNSTAQLCGLCKGRLWNQPDDSYRLYSKYTRYSSHLAGTRPSVIFHVLHQQASNGKPHLPSSLHYNNPYQVSRVLSYM